jgi:WD40 repeat protein
MSEFSFDVFRSHSSKDKAVVRGVAERLRADGLRVWFDEWILKPGDSIPAKIEDGLDQSRVPVLCMSANAFGSDWARLESGTFRFRDPLNKELRFIPLRLDEAPIKAALAHFLYIKWGPADREQEYQKLLDSCRPTTEPAGASAASKQVAEEIIRLERWSIKTYAFSPDGKRALTGEVEMVRAWSLETRRCLQVLHGHGAESVAWSADQRRVLSASSQDKTVWLWDLETGSCLRMLDGHSASVQSVTWRPGQDRTLSGSHDGTVRLWDLETGRCLRVLEGHTNIVMSVSWCADRRQAISGPGNRTVRVWDVETGFCLRVLEGHTDWIYSVGCSADQRLALSGADDKTVRLWDLEAGRCLSVLEGHWHEVRSVAWSADQRCAISGDLHGEIRLWDVSKFVRESRAPEAVRPVAPLPDQVQYTNAKVLLVGDSGAGKTGLSMRLAMNDWRPTDSTVGLSRIHRKCKRNPSGGLPNVRFLRKARWAPASTTAQCTAGDLVTGVLSQC